MGAYLNALREEATKDDLLIQIGRLLDERAAAEARLAEAVEVIEFYADNHGSFARARAFLAKLEGR